ncbi:MAG: sulfite exporter TauE/SafE family protein [Chloroflexi bacterium]|nr:sulfite exporter TauE/SafE family protein [Chloroflexota bacterium]
MIIVEVALGLTIGLLLGLLGGGGSILTVPALVYVLGQPAQAAVTASLVIVGSSSAFGATMRRGSGSLNIAVALLFGLSGMGAAYLTANLASSIPSVVLMLMFALLMLVVGIMMIARPHIEHVEAPRSQPVKVVVVGAAVGALTGVLGVGGGFLIVPALVMLVGLPMSQAVGTSLIVIAMNSVAGLAGHLSGASLDWALIATFALAGFVGTYLGTRLNARIGAGMLRKGFALFVIILALMLLADNLGRLMA